MNRLALLLVLLVSVTDAEVHDCSEIKESATVECPRTIVVPKLSGIMMGYYKYG